MRSILGMLLGLCLALLSSSACAGKQQRTSDLVHDVKSYGHGLRWSMLTRAAARLPAERRAEFLDRREQLVDELKIDDYEVIHLQMSKTDEERAEVHVRWTWHLDSKGIVQKTTTLQTWQLHGSQWFLEAEEPLRGDPMPGLDHEGQRAPAARAEMGGTDALQLGTKTNNIEASSRKLNP